MNDHGRPVSKSRRLAEIVREVKVAAAERDDVVVEMRDADRARLELLAQSLEDIIAEVPADDDQFDLALSSGLQPRFWIDAVSHVHMGRDRRTYRFVRDTRLGRTVISESANMDLTADAVARYVAERLIQRQRLLEGDFETMRESRAGSRRDLMERRSSRDDRSGRETSERMSPPTGPDAPLPSPHVTSAPRDEGEKRSRALLAALIWFFTGCIIGGLALITVFAERLAN
ncbi:hypothetical protein [Pararhizobium haloflavum]|uniref:hypothetical protein n=1 Tax=Pararhizobium haloflavum TaxID=2037914 RepID=UPI000C19C8B4|nr:hypothetical protein [Pararhizobium haloflavum]